MDLSTNMIHKYDKINAYSCKICPKIFKHKRNLQFHNRLHNGKLLISCDICNKLFRQKVHMLTHRRIHTGELPFSCDICAKKFTQKHSMLTHKRTHTDERMFNCDICNKSFTQKQIMVEHKRAQHSEEKIFKCEFCEREFGYRQSLSRHIKRAHSTNISIYNSSSIFSKSQSCEICGLVFITQGTFENHQKKHVSKSVRVIVKKLSVNDITKYLQKQNNYDPKEHFDKIVRVDVKNFSANVLSYSLHQFIERRVRVDIKKLSYPVKNVNDAKSEIKEEIKEEALENANDEKVLEGVDIFEDSYSSESFASGIDYVEKELVVEVKEECSEKDYVYSIAKIKEDVNIDELLDEPGDHFLENQIDSVCSRTTKDLPTVQNNNQVNSIKDKKANMLSTNIIKNTDIKYKRRYYIPGAFPCNICFKTFDCYERLENHMNVEKSTHYFDKEEPTCRICGKPFIKFNNLMIHTRSHLGITPYPCDACDRAFIDRARLESHKKTAHKKKSLQNKLCTDIEDIETLTNRKSIQDNNDTCTFNLGKGKRLKDSFSCEICSKSFNDLEDCMNHEQIHSKKLDKTSRRALNNLDGPNENCVEHFKENLKPIIELSNISQVNFHTLFSFYLTKNLLIT